MSISNGGSVNRRSDAAPATAHWATLMLRDRYSGFDRALTGIELHFAPGREVYREGDEAVKFYKVVPGLVRTVRFLSDGHRQIDEFHGAGDVFGFTLGSMHRLSAETVCECIVLSYRRHGLETLATSDDRVAGLLFSVALRSLERSREHCYLLGLHGAAQRLAGFLIRMADCSPTCDVIDMAMPRRDIADYLGLTVRTVSRTICQFERDGLVALRAEGRVWLKDRVALRDLVV